MNVNALSKVVSDIPVMLLCVASKVVVPRSTAKVLNVARPAISPEGKSVNPCGSSLNAPLFRRYLSVAPPRFTASTLSMLVLPLSIVPRSLGVIQETSESVIPVMVSENGYS